MVVDELDPVARVSGMKGVERISIFHALNQKAVAKRYAREKGVPYDQINLIVAHLGGGVSVAAHKKGRAVDVNNALDGEGPFSPERAGGLPVRDVIRLSYSGTSPKKNSGGSLSEKADSCPILAHPMRALCRRWPMRATKKPLVYEALSYQVAKEIGACAAVLQGKVDAILLTGGIAYDKGFVQRVKEATDWIADVVVYPGEDELEALAQGALRCLQGEEEVRRYD